MNPHDIGWAVSLLPTWAKKAGKRVERAVDCVLRELESRSAAVVQLGEELRAARGAQAPREASPELEEAERWLQEEQEWHKANGCPAINPGTVILDELARLRCLAEAEKMVPAPAYMTPELIAAEEWLRDHDVTVARQASERDRLRADNEAYCQHEMERAAEVLDLKQQLARQASELAAMRGENLAKDAALAEIAAAIREGVARIEYKSQFSVNRLAVALDSAETIGRSGHPDGEKLAAMRVEAGKVGLPTPGEPVDVDTNWNVAGLIVPKWERTSVKVCGRCIEGRFFRDALFGREWFVDQEGVTWRRVPTATAASNRKVEP